MAGVTKVRDNAWRVRWRYGGTRDGGDQTFTCKSKREADALKRAIEERGHLVRSRDPEVRDGSLIKGTPQTRASKAHEPTFREAAEGLMETKGAVRLPTRQEYQRVLDAHLLPRWGDRPVASIEKRDLSSLIAQHGIVKGGAGSNVWAMARMVLRHAQACGMRPDNPAMGMRLPPRGERVAMFLTAEERALILAAAAKHRTARKVWVPFVRVALEAGLRLSEVAGLQVGDVDLRNPDRPMLHVQRSYRPSGELRRDGGEVDAIMPLKSERSYRSITLDPALATALLPFVQGRHKRDPLLPDRDGGHCGRKTTESRWVSTVKRAQAEGLRCSPRFHDLRHTHASHLIEDLGMSLEYVSKRLGHSDIAITYRYYVHLTATSDDAYLAALRANGRRSRDASRRLRAVS